MKRVALARVAGFAPGLSEASAWQAWARAPGALAGEVTPDMGFLPAMQRRRCDGLSRMMLAAANAVCDEGERSEVPAVFASRHGSFGTTVSMLEALARDEALSPTAFSHSVHNTQVGLFSIWAGNRQPAQSLASCDRTFEHGFLEAVGLLDRHPGRAVLFVTGDEALPEPVEHLSSDPHPPYAVALLLREAGAAGTPVDFDLSAAGADDVTPLAWPAALDFLRWFWNDEPELRLASDGLAFSWRRGDS